MRVKDDKMEFEIDEKNLEDITEDSKKILKFGIYVADAIDND